MSKNRRPLTQADLARIETDAETLLKYIRDHGRPATIEGTVSVVKPRQRMAAALGWSVRRLSQAEQVLTAARAINAVSLLPRNADEAEANIYRWSTR